jgi:hypothetical protein
MKFFSITIELIGHEIAMKMRVFQHGKYFTQKLTSKIKDRTEMIVSQLVLGKISIKQIIFFLTSIQHISRLVVFLINWQKNIVNKEIKLLEC